MFFQPQIRKVMFERHADRMITVFRESAVQAEEKQDSAKASNEQQEASGDGTPDYDALYRAMQEYNCSLYENGQKDLKDQLSYEQPDFLLSDYGIDNGEILGTLRIPEIDVELPVLNGASYENMMYGAVYLAHTSLPIGGENTNCVIAAHNTWNYVPVFLHISDLEIGDVIYLDNFWGTIEYRVCETKVIQPDKSREIYIQSGRQLLTLSTCYPHPDNGQRYLVFAEQAE